MIREDVMRVLYNIDFSRLTDEQRDFLSNNVSDDEWRLLFEHHGMAAEMALRRAEALGFALSALGPWLRDKSGNWRLLGEALMRAPHELAETIVRRLRECGMPIDYSPEEQ